MWEVGEVFTQKCRLSDDALESILRWEVYNVVITGGMPGAGEMGQR